MAAQPRPTNLRTASGGWGRLKTATTDYLETVGLISKGDKRLFDLKAQENYYNEIVKRYMAFCALSTSSDHLEKQFASLSINDASRKNGHSTDKAFTPSQNSSSSQELSKLIFAMRKLREALVATRRTDTFAHRAYIFMIHAAILTRNMESYLPAILSLLHDIHPRHPLSAGEYQEVVGYQILDLACRQSNLAAAYALRSRHKVRDRNICQVLDALAHDNWFQFWRLKRVVDGYQKKLMEWAEDAMRRHALKCLARSYLTADKTFVERSTNRKWENLKSDGVGWELEGETIVIRRPRAK